MTDTVTHATEETKDAGPRNPAELLELRLATGALLYDNIVIGGLSLALDPDADGDSGQPVLWLNLGWLRVAGLGVRVAGDPDVDRTRSGLVLER